MGVFEPIGLIFTAVSTVASIFGSLEQGRVQEQNYKSQQRAAEANSRIAQMNAQIAENEGKTQAAQKQADWYKQLGRQRAAMAQGGVLESATGILVRAEAEEEAEADLDYFDQQSQMKELGYLFQASDYSNQAAQAGRNASEARRGGYLSAVGSLAGGLADGYGMHKKFLNAAPAGE